MNTRTPLAFLLIVIQAVLLSACGSDSGSGQAASPLSASEDCVSCHAGNSAGISPVTRMRITDEWLRSAHNYGNAAGCSTCHGTAHKHPSSCGQCHGGSASITPRFRNPDAVGQCDTCHGKGAKVRPLDVTGAQHYFKDTTRATYMFRNYQEVTGTADLCSRCHNPHDPSTFLHINRDYAKSGHGDVAGLAWTEEDFKRTACAYCHGTTTYLNFINSKATPQTFKPVAFDPADSTKEVLACIACHENYSWKLRVIAAQKSAFQSQEDSNQFFTFPDIGASNLCVVCHQGRSAGGNVEPLATASFTNQNFKHTHYMAAAGVMYGKVGFEFYSSHAAYAAGSFRHDQIGTTAFPVTGNRGPCVSCHMYPANHTLKTFDPATGFVSPVCGGCHTTARTSPHEFIEEMETEKTRYNASLDALKALLQTGGYYFYPASPYFYTAPFDPTYTETGSCSKNLPVRNWMTGQATTFTYAWSATARNCINNGTPGSATEITVPNTNPGISSAATVSTGKFNSYAASNWKALYSEPGGWAHRRRYVKRLLYDSIDWLDDNRFNYSVGKTLSNSGASVTDAVKYLVRTATRGGTDYINLTGTDNADQRP